MKFIKREVLKQKPDFSNLVFGKNISDYMLECDYADGKWGEPVIKPVEDFALSPATMIFHYGQGIFEGCKCFKNEKGVITLFRIRDNLNRMNRSAERMSMPKIDVEEMLKGLKELIKIEKDWIPDKEGQSLYIRPTMIATESSIGVKTCWKFQILHNFKSRRGISYGHQQSRENQGGGQIRARLRRRHGRSQVHRQLCGQLSCRT